MDLVTGEVEVLTSHIPWDIDEFTRSDDGRYLAWVANVDGISRLTVVDVARRAELLPPLPEGRIGRIEFDPTGKRLALTLESPQAPRDVFVFELERNAVVRMSYISGSLRIVTEGRALDRAAAGEPVRVMNLTSKQTVAGTVAADGSVEIGR